MKLVDTPHDKDCLHPQPPRAPPPPPPPIHVCPPPALHSRENESWPVTEAALAVPVPVPLAQQIFTQSLYKHSDSRAHAHQHKGEERGRGNNDGVAADMRVDILCLLSAVPGAACLPTSSNPSPLHTHTHTHRHTHTHYLRLAHCSLRNPSSCSRVCLMGSRQS